MTKFKKDLHKNIGTETISSLSSSKGLTIPVGAEYATFQAETQNVRMRDDGTAPTASTGFKLEKNLIYNYYGELDLVNFIEETASATINISYYS